MRFFSFAILINFFSGCGRQASLPISFIADPTAYQFQVDLTQVRKDRLQVILYAPEISEGVATYCLPAIVPGIYGAMDFGQYVSEFKALDQSGRELPVSKIDDNCWTIENAGQLQQITYLVDDTWDQFTKSATGNFYRSAGCSFSRGEVFVINHNCLFGYFKELDDLPYQIAFRRPKNFFGASSLIAQTEENIDRFTAPNYRELVDAPILYSRPDTTWIDVAGARVLVSVNSNHRDFDSKVIAWRLRPLLQAQREYLGGELPVDRYAFMVYHNSISDRNFIFGDALEHSQSSLYLIAAKNVEEITSFIYWIAAHEFFHILTPLNIHSEAIARYDFNDANRSSHLWLYEGMTEYAAMHMPVRQGLIPTDEFIQTVGKKIAGMKSYDESLSLTELSMKALELQDQYYNFYLKGALLGLCLDIRLRELSGGDYGAQELMRDLSEKHGKDRPFREEELFDVIAEMTYPEIRELFRRHVEGVEPLPLKELLPKVGIDYNERAGAVKWNSNPSPEQVKLRKAWIGR